MTGRTRPVLVRPRAALSSGGSPVIAGSTPYLSKLIRSRRYSAIRFRPGLLASWPLGLLASWPLGLPATSPPAFPPPRAGRDLSGRGCEPGVDPGQQLLPLRLRSDRAQDGSAGQVGELGVGEPVCVP